MNKKAPVNPLTDFLYNKASALHMPFSGTFELSPVCNFACRMCYVRKTQQEVDAAPRRMVTCEEWLRIAEQARQQGMLFLLLTGGEPLLWPRFKELYVKLLEMGFIVSINTNGSLIDERMAAFFHAYPPQRINITLYGASDETYEALCGAKHVYSRVTRGIELLREQGVSVKLNCSLTPYNVGDLEKMVIWAREHQVLLQATSYMFPPLRRDETAIGQNDRFTPEETARYRLLTYKLQSGSAEAYRRILDDILDGTAPMETPDEQCIDPVDGRIRCRAGRACFWITWDGRLSPCGMMVKPWVDLYETPFPAAWEKLNGICDEIRLSGKCARCPNADACHACAAMAYTETGSFSGTPDYLCRTTAALLRLAEEERKNPDSDRT